MNASAEIQIEEWRPDRPGAATLDHEIEVLRLEFRADMANGHRRIIQWNVATLIAAVTVIITVVRLG